MFRPEPPQGFTTEQGQIIIARPPIPLFAGPQGIGEAIEPVDPIITPFPPLADATFQFYKFYQIKKNQVPTTQTNMPVVIIDTLGADILQQASGFDIRVFSAAGTPLPYEVQSVNITTGDIIVWVNMTTVQDSEFVQLTFGKESATDGSTPNTVYDSNYKMVLHFDTASLIDSTSNNNSGFNAGSIDIAGKIGRARKDTCPVPPPSRQ